MGLSALRLPHLLLGLQALRPARSARTPDVVAVGIGVGVGVVVGVGDVLRRGRMLATIPVEGLCSRGSQTRTSQASTLLSSS